MGKVKCKWFFLKIKFYWDNDNNPRTYLDLMIIRLVFHLIILLYKDKIKRYRVHRRWMNDDDGHQLSFIYYTNKATHNKIKTYIKKSEFLNELKEEGIIERIQNVDENKTEIEDTSDSQWYGNVRIAWPVFAQGATDMLIHLIELCAKNNDRKLDSFIDICLMYRDIQEALDTYMYVQGNHSLIHHIRGIFGYPKVGVRLKFRDRLKCMFYKLYQGDKALIPFNF